MTATRGEPLRMNRFLAVRGVSSRRGADALIASGRVTLNGRAAVLGDLVDPSRDTVAVDGVPVPRPLAPRTLMLNKPRGFVSTRADTHGRPTVLDLVEDREGLAPVGRLDVDSRGLILLTNDGDLAFQLTHPRHGITKTYRVAVHGTVTDRVLRLLRSGVELEDGPARALSAEIVERGRGGDVLEIVMGEGRKREVRRLLAALGLPVLDLQRIAVGPLRLGRLLEGTSRPLTRQELAALDAAGRPAPAAASPRPARRRGAEPPRS